MNDLLHRASGYLLLHARLLDRLRFEALFGGGSRARVLDALRGAHEAEALVAGDTGKATHMLSRDFAVEGVVQNGDRRGRELGYPTANLTLGDYQRPKYGIYAVRVTLDDGSEVPGVASFGVRPTFEPAVELLEAHLFDFDGDLYGRHIEVEFVAKLRDEEKFDDLGALVVQMHRDAAEAREILAASRTAGAAA